MPGANPPGYGWNASKPGAGVLRKYSFDAGSSNSTATVIVTRSWSTAVTRVADWYQPGRASSTAWDRVSFEVYAPEVAPPMTPSTLQQRPRPHSTQVMIR